MSLTLLGNYFNNEFSLSAITGIASVEVVLTRYNPANLDKIIWECPVDYSHIEKVMESATSGHEIWKKVSFEERASFLKRYQEELIVRKSDLANALSLETGRPLWDTMTEAEDVINFVTVAIEHSLVHIQGKEFTNMSNESVGKIHFRPIGICLCIGPSVLPAQVANQQLVSALIAGNAVIYKPSPKTCYSSQVLFECFNKAKFPKGTVNLIQGDEEMGRRLLNEKEIKSIFFTGTTENGRKVHSQVSKDLSKLLTLNLSGNNCTILDKTIDIDEHVDELVNAAFMSSGQRCNSTSLAFIHKSLLDEFVEKFHIKSKELSIDDPLSATDPFMGPLSDQEDIERYLLYIGMAKREGLEEVMRGKQLDREAKGNYASPSIHIVKEWNPKSFFVSDEVLGPSCTFIPFESVEEVVEYANSSAFGLVSSVNSSDKEFINYCLANLDYGRINVNKPTTYMGVKLPFGGIKDSGNYHPGWISTIRSCVYPISSLEKI